MKLDRKLKIVNVIIAACLFVMGGAMVVAGLTVMFGPPHNAAGFFLLASGLAVAYGGGKLVESPTRPFEDQYRDFGGY